MRTTILAVLLLPLLLLTGCGIDKERAQAQLAALEAQATNLRAFIAQTAPQVAALASWAAESKDPSALEAAARITTALRAAQEALPKVEATIGAAKDQLKALEADAAGKVPWWSALVSLALLVPRLLGGGPVAEGVANLLWSLFATKKQKDEDLKASGAA